MARLTGKLMNDKIKMGWTMEDLARHLGVTEDIFCDMLRRTFSDKACKDMFNSLYKNEKNKNKYMNRAKKRTKQICPENALEETKLPEEEIPISEVLKQQEEMLSKQICELEIKSKEYLSEREKIVSTIRVEKETLIKLKQEIKFHENKMEEAIETLDDLNNVMKEMNNQINSLKVDFENVQEELKELEKIEILAYEDGSIEVVDTTTIEVPDSWESIFDSLITDERAENLTLGQIKQLAKLIAYTNLLEEQEVRFSITFESENEQELYSNIA